MIIVDPVCKFSSIYRICTFLIFFIILLIGVIGTAKSQPCAKSCLVLNIRVPSYGKIKEKWHSDPRGWAYKRGLVSGYVIINKSISFNKVYWENRARIAWLSLSYIYWVYHLMLIYLPRSFSYQFLQFPEMWTAERKAAAAGMGPTWILGSHLCLLKGQTPPVPTSVADEQPNCVPSGPSSYTIPAYDILLFKIIAKAQNSQFCSFNIAKKISFLVKTQYLAVWPGLEPRSSL